MGRTYGLGGATGMGYSRREDECGGTGRAGETLEKPQSRPGLSEQMLDDLRYELASR